MKMNRIEIEIEQDWIEREKTAIMMIEQTTGSVDSGF